MKEPARPEDVVELAKAVFGNEKKAERWLAKPSRVLGAVPRERMRPPAGAAQVVEELYRIRYGIDV
jgi:uncharacterized protein (DUF2384 family)